MCENLKQIHIVKMAYFALFIIWTSNLKNASYIWREVLQYIAC